MSIHHKNLQSLATEIFKIEKNLNPSFLTKIFEEKDIPYALCSGRNILAPKQSRTGYGIENAHFFGAKIWCTMSSSLKGSQNIEWLQKRY